MTHPSEHHHLEDALSHVAAENRQPNQTRARNLRETGYRPANPAVRSTGREVYDGGRVTNQVARLRAQPRDDHGRFASK